MNRVRIKSSVYVVLLVLCYIRGYAQCELVGVVSQNGQPVYMAKVSAVLDSAIYVHSKLDGKFRLKLPCGPVQIEVTKYGYEVYAAKIEVVANDPAQLQIELTPKSNVLSEVNIKSKRNKKQPKESISTEAIVIKQEQSNPSGNVEQLLKFQGLGVGGNNELGSQYNVRGGNFDENAVYVNGYETYRPQLIRSAQQEGLSFTNSILVDQMKFSSGGFAAQYGDKLSSVLDITYRKTKEWAGSLEAGLMGLNAHIEAGNGSNWSAIAGLRYRDNSYLLSSQETKGSYLPKFIDWQHLIQYQLADGLKVDWLLNVSRNDFLLIPEDRKTNFGLVNFALTYLVKYKGREVDRYSNLMNGLGLSYIPSDNLSIKYQFSQYEIEETQRFDITGTYAIGELDTDINSSNYQNLKTVLGAGVFQNWGRDRYKASMKHHNFNLSWLWRKHYLKSGYKIKHENISIRLDEWDRLDSADYVLPIGSQIQFQNVVNAEHFLTSTRHEFFVQDQIEWNLDSGRKFGINVGLRGNYWSVNREMFWSPRFQAYIYPIRNQPLSLSLAVGSYNQPPFFREMLDRRGQLNTNLKSQKSIHYILGMDYVLPIFNRPFKFTAEVYHKHLWDVNTYQYENVLVRYRANNSTIAYAQGIDLRLQGELVKDAESWFNIGLLNTRENTNDRVWRYYDSTGAAYLSPSINGITIVDSAFESRGFVPRQSQQLLTFNLYYQDYIPKMPNLKSHLNFVWASGLPFGPPDNLWYRNQFKLKNYLRLDIGMSLTLYDRAQKSSSKGFVGRHLKSIWGTLELFNILDFTNEVSMSWIRDYNSNQLAVPNNLTGRRINARLVFKF